MYGSIATELKELFREPNASGVQNLILHLKVDELLKSVPDLIYAFSLCIGGYAYMRRIINVQIRGPIFRATN